MTRAGTALAAVLAAVALAAGCTSEAEPDPPLPTDDRPFGPDPDFEEHTTSLMTATSDKDVATLCADLETSLTGAGLVIHTSEAAGEEWCGYSVDTLEPADADERSTSGTGAAVPLRLYAWHDGSTAQVSYFDPAPMLVAVDIEDEALAEEGTTFAAGLSAAVAEAAGSEPEPGGDAVATYTEINSEVPSDELSAALQAAAESSGMQALHVVSYDEGGSTMVVTYQGEGAGPTAPEALVANRVNLHIWTDDSGNGVISYFDPMPLMGAVGADGADLSTMLSDVAWEAALPQ